ncbi:MAG: Gp37 family protein, partial [Candidatus Methylomirabilis sp.]|nr:Gp37 family protein [Deltaproteobacteria bacterium]
MANQIKRVEDAIVARLRAFYAPDALAVEPFPEDREKYRLAHPKGAALVAFAGERFGPDSGVGMVRQERTMRFA